MSTHGRDLLERFWSAVEHMWANNSLKLNEISEPVLGLIFLKLADFRFRREQEELEKIKAGRQRPVFSDDYKALKNR